MLGDTHAFGKISSVLTVSFRKLRRAFAVSSVKVKRKPRKQVEIDFEDLQLAFGLLNVDPFQATGVYQAAQGNNSDLDYKVKFLVTPIDNVTCLQRGYGCRFSCQNIRQGKAGSGQKIKYIFSVLDYLGEKELYTHTSELSLATSTLMAVWEV